MTLGAIGTRVIYTSLYKPTARASKVSAYVVGAAVAAIFSVTWAIKGMDPIQLGICAAFEQAPECIKRRAELESRINPAPAQMSAAPPDVAPVVNRTASVPVVRDRNASSVFDHLKRPGGTASMGSVSPQQVLPPPPTVAPSQRPLHEVTIAPATQPTSVRKVIKFQPGPAQVKDIWTTSIYSNAPGGGGPGGGLHNDVLLVGGWADLYYSLIQFELSDPKLPRQATSATLRLFASAKPGAGSSTSMTLHRIAEPWDWRTRGTGKDRERLWWADKPATVLLQATSVRPAILPPPRIGDFNDIDITDLYNDWMSDPSRNFGLELRPTQNQNSWNQFFSSNSADPSRRPQLVVVP